MCLSVSCLSPAAACGSVIRVTLLYDDSRGFRWLYVEKLTASEYDETTWSARTWMAFATQRLSVASQLSMAQEAAEALGLSVAADPRAQ